MITLPWRFLDVFKWTEPRNEQSQHERYSLPIGHYEIKKLDHGKYMVTIEKRDFICETKESLVKFLYRKMV